MRWFKRASSSESPRLLSLSPLRNGEIVGASIDSNCELSTTAATNTTTNNSIEMTNSIMNKNQIQQQQHQKTIGNNLRKSRIGMLFFFFYL